NSRFGERLVVERVAVELRVRLEAHASGCERRNTHSISVCHTQAAEFGRPEIPNLAFLEKPNRFRIADHPVCKAGSVELIVHRAAAPGQPEWWIVGAEAARAARLHP